MKTKGKSCLEGLSENARRVLFLLMAVPGAKNVAMLREVLGLGDDACRQGLVNALTIQTCEELQRARLVKFNSSGYTSNSNRVCQLAGAVPLSLLSELAAEGTKKGWWPNRGAVYQLCRGVGFRAANAEIKHLYEGQEEMLEGVSHLVRLFLTGEGDAPDQKSKSAERLWIAFVEHWTTVADSAGDIFGGAGRGKLPLAVMTLALDTLFLKGCDVRATLDGVVDECLHRVGELRASDLFEVSALAVWTGRMDFVRKLNERDWTSPFALRYLDALMRLPDERAVFDLFAELQGYVEEKKGRSTPVQGAAFACLAMGVALRTAQPAPVLAQFKRFLDGSGVTCDPVKSTLVLDNRHRRQYFLSDFRSADTPYFSSAYERRLYIHCSPGDVAELLITCLFFLSWGNLPKSKLTAARDDLLKTVPSISIALSNGYPTVAAAMVAIISPFIDAQTSAELAEKVNAAGGFWIWPLRSPEETWRDALAELEQTVRTKPRQRNADPGDAEDGEIGWALRFRPLGSGEKNEMFDLSMVQPLLVRTDERGHTYCEDLKPNDVLSRRFDSVRTPQDALILAVYLQRVSISITSELVDRLIGHPRLFMLAESSMRWEYICPETVELLAGKFRIDTRVRESGGLELSIPGWMCEISAAEFFHLERPGLYVHYNLGKRERTILGIFRERGVNGTIRVPKEGVDAVAALLPNLMAHVRVTGACASTAEERDGSIPVKAGGAQGVARLRFADDVLGIDLGIACSVELPFAVPEVGDAEAILHGADGLYLLRRDFAAETAALGPFVAALDPVLNYRVATYSWRIPDLQLAIAALERLQSFADLRLEWPEGRSLTLAEASDCRLSFSGLSKERGWFEVRGRFEIDPQHALTIFEALAALRKGTGEYIRLSEGRFLRLTESLRRKLSILDAASRRASDALEVSPAAVLPLARTFEQSEDGGELPDVIRERARDLAKILRKRQRPPKGLNATLRDYQLQGYEWMARLAECGFGACLADDMGLGKTVQTIALLLARAKDGPSLVVAPASVCGNWKAEIGRFAPSLSDSVEIVSYGMLVSRTSDYVDRDWNGVVLDEAQAIKNEAAKRTETVKRLKAKFRIVATGTPVENRLTELWSIFDFLNPGLLGSSSGFAERLTVEGKATSELKRLVAPFILRRLKSEVLSDLPPKTEITLPVELGPKERTAYEACRIHALESLKGSEENRISILAELMRLRRFCCHPSLVLKDMRESAKLDALRDLLTDLRAADHRALVFSQFTDYLAIVRRVIEENGWTCQYLDGATPTKARGEAVAAFQRGEGDFFLISLKAGGMGLNLTAANYVIILDPWWNPAVENQAADRVHRIGQKNPVTIYRLIAAKTVEERVLELHAEKKAIAADILDGTGKSALTPEALMKLFG